MKQNRGIRGITLIALVITIVVLLILAAVTISALSGDNGIINRAVESKNNSAAASDLEYLKIEAIALLSEYYGSRSNIGERKYVLTQFNDETKYPDVTADVESETVTYKGKNYDISEILGNTDEENAIVANGLVKITINNIEKVAPNNLELASLFNVDNSNKISMIVGEIEKVGDVEKVTKFAVIPLGFYYVTGKPSTGVVISDVLGDDDNNTKGGNQFVWVPCSTTINSVAYNTTVTYGKDTESFNSDGYETYTWNDTWNNDTGFSVSSNQASVEQYGGFYMGRFEAGLPESSGLWANKSGAAYKVTGRNSSTIIPVSKKNNASWNRITQINAEKVAYNMKQSSTSVRSYLVDSYAWDTTVNWFKETGTDITNSTSYGNFKDSYNNTKNTINGLYALHEFEDAYGWHHGSTYGKGLVYLGYGRPQNGTSTYVGKYVEIATGSYEETKVNNIYDMAGNVWEWTTETTTKNNGYEYAIIRGSCFSNSGDKAPLGFRYGDFISNTDWEIILGFRVVLYVK